MAILTGTLLGKKIANALGLQNTTDIKIHFPCRDVITIEATMFMNDEQGKRVLDVLESHKYELTKIEEFTKEGE